MFKFFCIGLRKLLFYFISCKGLQENPENLSKCILCAYHTFVERNKNISLPDKIVAEVQEILDLEVRFDIFDQHWRGLVIMFQT